MPNLWCEAWIKDIGEPNGRCKKPTKGGALRCPEHMKNLPLWPANDEECSHDCGHALNLHQSGECPPKEPMPDDRPTFSFSKEGA